MEPKFKKGDSIKITSGPSAGYLGTVEQLDPQRLRDEVVAYEYLVKIWQKRDGRQIPSLVKVTEQSLTSTVDSPIGAKT
jgi:transcription antitermination factor NusG